MIGQNCSIGRTYIKTECTSEFLCQPGDVFDTVQNCRVKGCYKTKFLLKVTQ